MSETLGNTALALRAAGGTDGDTESLPLVPPTKLSDRHELFVQELMRGASLMDAYRAVYPKCVSREAVRINAMRLRARSDVQERMAELTRIAAQAAVIDRGVLMAQLYELATAPADELVSVVTEACPLCWPTEALAAAIDRGEMPDPDSPNKGCAACKGRGVKRLHIADTHELSAAARRLFAGAEYKPDGSIKVHIADQIAARRELHELLGMKVSRSESRNLNINATVAAPTVASVDDVLAAYHAHRGVTR